MKTSPFKVMTSAALATSLALPVAVTTVDAAEVELKQIAFELDGEVQVVDFNDYVDAIVSESGDLYDYVTEASPEAIGVGEGSFVSYEALVNAIIDDEEGKTGKEVLAEVSTNEEALVSEDTVAEYKQFGEDEVVAPAVQSVNAPNLKTLEVTFNTSELNADAVKDTSNYTLEDADGNSYDVDSVELNGEIATLTLTNQVSNQTDVTVTVDEKVTGEEVSKDVNFFDAEIPVAEDIKLVGPNKFKIIFSEPIETAGTVEVENGIYGTLTPTVNGNEVTVELSASALAEGDYSVEVSDFYDYAGYKALKEEFTLNYEKDATTPEASIKSASQTEVVVEFNKPVENEDGETLSAEYFYHTFTSYNPDNVSVSADGTEYTLTFNNNPLAEGQVDLVVNYDANSSVVQDEWGNELTSNLVLETNISADHEEPVVTDVKVEDEQTVKVYFSENVVKGDAEEEDNYTFLNSDEEEVTPSDITYSADSEKEEYVATVEFNKVLNGNYTVEVGNIDDRALEANTLDTVTHSFNVEDLTGPVLSDVEATGVNGEGADYIYVTFPEKMATSGEYSVLNKNNYVLNYGGETVSLSSDDKLELFKDSSKVKITLADETDLDLTSDQAGLLTVARLADASGNPSAALSANVNVDADVSPAVTAVEQVDYKSVEITFDQALKTVSANAIKVSTDGGSTFNELAAVSWELNSDNDTVVTGTLKADSQVSQTDSSAKIDEVQVVNDGDVRLVSETGNEVAADVFGDDTGETIQDSYVPTLAEDGATSTTAGEIDLTFTESVTAGSSDATKALAASNFKVYDGADELTSVTDSVYADEEGEYFVNFGSDDSSVTIEVYGKDGEELDVEYTGNKYFTDGNGNKVQDFSVTLDVYSAE